VSGNWHPYRDPLRASARSPGRDLLSRRSATNRAFTGMFSMQATMRSISRSSQQEVGFASCNSFSPLQHAAADLAFHHLLG